MVQTFHIVTFRQTPELFSYEVIRDDGVTVYECSWGFVSHARAEDHARGYCARHGLTVSGSSND